ncbi:uncharacterized protein [Haliotis cracherodii]|uniref:uncharacterized protein n=1 Tax=Haliotis cracherodii TaxID=6455 RepID=UPI0039ED0F46
MLKLICVVAVLGCSVAEKRCPPKSWRAEEVSLGLYLPKVDNVYQPRKEGDHSLVYYDADNKRSAIISNFTVGSKTGDNKYIFDYTAGKKYMIDLKANTCKSESLTGTFKEWCITDDATFLYDAKLGYTADGTDTVDAKIYYTENVVNSHTVGHVTAITSDLNVPIQSYTFGRGGDKYLLLSLVGNVASPIPAADADVFTPPASCSSSYLLQAELDLSAGPLRRLLLGL